MFRHFQSGRVARCFVSIDKILKPVLYECVAPVSCYSRLGLILHGGDEIMPVFKEPQIPEISIPVWKGFSAVADFPEMFSKWYSEIDRCSKVGFKTLIFAGSS